MPYYVPNSTKFVLMALLLLLNIVIRIPSIPHERGYDSFFIHSLANSISNFGAAEWWINWMSVFGLYPYSYASAVPFTLSGMSQLTGIEMEKAILLYCVVLGLLSMFIAYIFAKNIYNNFIFAYIMALFFSVAPGVLGYTTWEVSTRGQFIVFLPLYLFLLLKSGMVIKKSFLMLVFFVLLFATHHYAYFLVPLTVLYVVLSILEKTKFSFFNEPYLTYICLVGLIIVLVFPFSTRMAIESGSRYDWIIAALITNARYAGPVILFLLGGFTFLFQKKKNYQEMFILFAIVLCIPALYSHTYGPFLLLLFTVLLASVGFNNVLHTLAKHKHKFLMLYVIFIICSCVVFSSYYNHNRTGRSESFWYMTDETYVAGSWGKEHVPANSRGLDTGFETGRMFAISEGHPITPSIGAGNLAYGFIDKSEIEYVKNSMFSKEYYFEGPYSVKAGTASAGRIEWLRQYGRLNDLKAFDYYIQDKYQYKPILNVVQLNSNQIYDSARIAIWEI